MTEMKLPSMIKSKAVERRLRHACNALGYRGNLEYEHEHWWLVLPDGSVYDVVDQDSGEAVDGFALERIS